VNFGDRRVILLRSLYFNNEINLKSRWIVSVWSECSASCGGGTQKRRMWCENNMNEQVKNRKCDDMPKPDRRQKCNEQECPAVWHIGSWTEVDVDTFQTDFVKDWRNNINYW